METKTPQLENGYLKIANDIARYLAKTYMSSYESQILWAIFIKTYGFNKKEDWISNSQFVEITEMHKAHVSRTIKKLIGRRIVTQTGNKIAFQKDSRLWCKLPNQVTVKKELPKRVQLLPKQVTQLPKQADTINTYTKDTYTTNNSLVEKITLWAYKRARVNPACNEQSFRTSVLSAIQQLGEGRVKRMFEVEDNAIQFLRNIKAV